MLSRDDKLIALVEELLLLSTHADKALELLDDEDIEDALGTSMSILLRVPIRDIKYKLIKNTDKLFNKHFNIVEIAKRNLVNEK